MPRFSIPGCRNRVREYRELLAMTQHQLAEAAGISRPTLARLDANPNARPSMDTAVRLARAFGIDVSELVS